MIKRLIKSINLLYNGLRSLRMFWYRKRFGLKNVSKTFYIGGKSSLSKDLRAADYSYIGPNCQIGPKVRIGKYTMLANNVSIVGGDHLISDPNKPIIFSGRPILKETNIGQDVWIGAFSVIMAGITIGNGAIVGSGSIVTKDIPEYSIYAGNPARFLRMRFNDEEISLHKEMLSQNKVELNYCSEKF